MNHQGISLTRIQLSRKNQKTLNVVTVIPPVNIRPLSPRWKNTGVYASELCEVARRAGPNFLRRCKRLTHECDCVAISACCDDRITRHCAQWCPFGVLPEFSKASFCAV